MSLRCFASPQIIPWALAGRLCPQAITLFQSELFHWIVPFFLSIVLSFHWIFNYCVASYVTLVYSSVAFHIYPYLRGNSIPSDRNYRLVSGEARKAKPRSRICVETYDLWLHDVQLKIESPLELITQIYVRSILADDIVRVVWAVQSCHLSTQLSRSLAKDAQCVLRTV